MPEWSTERFRGLNALLQVPVLRPIARTLIDPMKALRRQMRFPGSSSYWEERYRAGGTSGAGSYGRLARFKAEILNDFVTQQNIASVAEFGCGDGAQLALAHYPNYVGIDVAASSIELCRERFAQDTTKRFHLAGELPAALAGFDLALSLDVIYHLVEDAVFNTYMTQLFAHSGRFVAIYASNTDRKTDSPHVRHRQFSRWIDRNAPHWRLWRHVPNRYPFDPAEPDNSSFADFYFFHRDLEESQRP
ncbi:MAG: class I SAM-dependent methyltransferase [Aliidongia sp.]